MKKICSLVCMIWVMVAVQAQGDYVPFPKSNAEWRVAAYNGLKYSEMHGGSLYHPHNTFCYRMEEYDTLIEGINYSSIMLIGVYEEGEHKAGYCAFREENKKVYVYMPGCGEHLLYDFSLKIGDTISYTIKAMGNLDRGFAYGIDEIYPHSKMLVSIDTIELNTGEKRRIWHFVGIGAGSQEGHWIEGIGDISWLGIFEPFVYDDCWGGDEFTFSCFSQNQETIYIPSCCKDCNCKEARDNVINIMSLGISIFPNPVCDKLKIENRELKMIDIQIVDALGKVIMEIESQNESELILDMTPLHSGLYFVKISSNESSIVKKVIKQ